MDMQVRVDFSTHCSNQQYLHARHTTFKKLRLLNDVTAMVKQHTKE
jgi:hypothetical protein